MRRSALTIIIIICAAATTALAFEAKPRVRERGWAPWVALASGERGSPQVAVERIASGISTIGAVLNGLEADEQTRGFFKKVMGQLESMDLEALYETLPESDTPWRRVRFTGRRISHEGGDGYRVATVAPAELCACVPDAPLGGRFGDLAVSVRSRPATTADGKASENFVGDAQIGLGLGSGSLTNMLAAIVEAVKLTETGAPDLAKRVDAAARPSIESRAKVVADNPKLGPEDVEVLAVFRESYPNLYDHLTGLYEVQDILVWDPLGDSPYRQIRFVIAVRQEAMEKNYPDLYEFLSGLGPLARGRADVLDKKGRTLFTFGFSTKDMAIELDAFAKDGAILPIDCGNAVLAEPVDVRAVTQSQHSVRWNLAFDMNGIVTEVRDLTFDVTYARKGDDAKLSLAMTNVPIVAVSGSAFGIVPTWAIDVFIPGNMEELTRSFFRALAKGNDGRGLETDVTFKKGDRTSVMELHGAAEGLNNGLVRLGFKIARHKLIPNDAAVADIGRALRGTHGAFSKDLEAFSSAIKK